MPQLQTEGVILRVIDFRETDRIVHVYTKDLGKLSAVARHATKSRKRFGTTLNVFQLVRLKLKQKPQSSLAVLEQVRPLVSFAGIYSDWRRIIVACVIADFVNEMTREGHVNSQVYQVSREALLALNRGESALTTLTTFQYHLLEASGYRPTIRYCVSCRREWEEGESIYWVHRAGGAHCHRCLPRDVAFETVLPELRFLLEQIATGQEVSDLSAITRAATLLYEFIRFQLGRPIRSWEFLEQMKLLNNSKNLAVNRSCAHPINSLG